MKKSYIILIFACLFPLHMQAMTILLGRGQALLAQVGSQIGLISPERAKPENFIQPNDPRAEQWGVTASAGAGACDAHSSGVSGSLQAAGRIQLRPVDEQVSSRLQALKERINPDKQNQAKRARFDELHGIVKQAQLNIEMYNLLVEDHTTTQHVTSPEVKKLLELQLQSPANFIPSNQTLQDLEDHATSMTNEADLSFTSHVQASQEYCAKKLPHTGFFMQQFMGYPLGAATYCKDIAVPQGDMDYFAGAVGAGAVMGAASLVSKNSSNATQIACLGLGFASGVALKRMISQSFFKDLNILKLQGIKAAILSDHDRLFAFKQALAACIQHSEVTTKIESVADRSNIRHEQLTAGLEQARNAAQDARTIAEQTNIGVVKVSQDLIHFRDETNSRFDNLSSSQARFFANHDAVLQVIQKTLGDIRSDIVLSKEDVRRFIENNRIDENKCIDYFASRLDGIEEGQKKIQAMQMFQLLQQAFQLQLQVEQVGVSHHKLTSAQQLFLNPPSTGASYYRHLTRPHKYSIESANKRKIAEFTNKLNERASKNEAQVKNDLKSVLRGLPRRID